jgi:hypothetical protein
MLCMIQLQLPSLYYCGCRSFFQGPHRWFQHAQQICRCSRAMGTRSTAKQRCWELRLYLRTRFCCVIRPALDTRSIYIYTYTCGEQWMIKTALVTNFVLQPGSPSICTPHTAKSNSSNSSSSSIEELEQTAASCAMRLLLLCTTAGRTAAVDSVLLLLLCASACLLHSGISHCSQLLLEQHWQQRNELQAEEDCY